MEINTLALLKAECKENENGTRENKYKEEIIRILYFEEHYIFL